MLACVLEELPADLRPRPDNYFYKKHADHAGFKAPPELQAVVDSQRAREAAAAKAKEEAEKKKQQQQQLDSGLETVPESASEESKTPDGPAISLTEPES